MVGRRVVCAIALMGIAAPAAAGERPGYSAAADALNLLLQDDSTTFASRVPLTQPAPGFDVARRIASLAEPLPDTLARFEALTVPAAIALPGSRERTSRSAATIEDFALSSRPTMLRSGTTFDARDAIDDAMADYPRPYRRRAMFDTMLTLRLDGEERTRSFTVGGIAGVVWGVLPRR